MNYEALAELSFYDTIASINPEHNISLVQHRDTRKIYVKKVLSVYNLAVYEELMTHPVAGIPKIELLYESEANLTIIEEYISGQTLEELLAQNGALTEGEVVVKVSALCSILHTLHTLPTPLIHRDIKPSNVMITPDNKVILLDLNAARTEVSKSEDTTLLGTKGYAAPEQYGFGSSDARTDIYALGMLMNTMLYGNFTPKVFSGSVLSPIIRKCTELNPKDRYANVQQLDAALKAITPDTHKKPIGYRRFLPPGFRSLSLPNMFVATAYYLFFAWISLTLQVEGTFGAALWFERILSLVMFFAIPACAFNYLGIQRFFPMCNNKNRYLALAGRILFALIAAVSIFFLMLIGIALLFQ